MHYYIDMGFLSQVIFYEQDWNPQADKQAVQRAHRIGQVNPVLAINLVAEDTIDEVLLNILLGFICTCSLASMHFFVLIYHILS